MTFEEWARLVDSLLIEQEPSQRFALEGRSSERDYRGEDIPSEHFVSPRWRSSCGFVYMSNLGEDRQASGSYWPVSAGLQSGQRITVVPPEVFYDRDKAGAEKAASEIAAFLLRQTIPNTQT